VRADGPERLGYRPALDGLRAVAVVLVLIKHSGVPVMTGAGAIGVGIFFTLSGFLITTLMLEEHAKTGRIDVGRFYLRRALRLLPAITAVLIFLEVGSHVFHRPQMSVGVGWTAVYLSNWAQLPNSAFPYLGHTWSLAVEEQFYLFWPVTLLVLIRWFGTGSRLVRGIVVIAGASAAWRATLILFGVRGARLTIGTDVRLDGLLLGCAVAALLRTRRVELPFATAVAGAVGLFALTLPDPQRTAVRLVESTLVALASIPVILDLVGGTSPLARSMKSKVLVHLGRISYGIYLWHYPVFQLLRPHIHQSIAIRGVLMSLASIAVAEVSFYVIEQPFLRLKNRQRAVPVTAAA
jgi:peptidoglycan/LPS O-acetylase OafA/YrhL